VARTEAAMQDNAELGGERVRVHPLTRIQGHADIEIQLTPDGKVIEARFRALEFRGFEEMATGIAAFRAPSLLSRICGSCGPFHQLAACMAIEDAAHATVPRSAIWFRELLSFLCLGLSHILNCTYMTLPDFALPTSDAAVRNVIGIYAIEQEMIQNLSAVQVAFADSLALFAGLPIHPAVVVPGGVSYLPDWTACSKVGEAMAGCEHNLRETLRLVELLTKRSAQMMETETSLKGYYMASTKGENPALLGEVVTCAEFDEGEPWDLDYGELYESIEERPVPWSYLVPVAVSEIEPLIVGPLARVNLGFDTETPWAELECTRIHEHWGHPLDMSLLFLMSMTLEMIWAYEKVCLLLEQRPRHGEACTVPDLTEGDGMAVIDGPRGTLVHKVWLDSDGVVARYKVISPLQFSSLLLNRHLTEVARRLVTGLEISEEAAQRLQLSVRAFTPCVQCGTH
jgi:F420-non-reducing hydrogenase large subunit